MTSTTTKRAQYKIEIGNQHENKLLLDKDYRAQTHTPINVNNIDRMIFGLENIEWPLYPMAYRWSDVNWDFIIIIVANHFRTGILMLNRNRYRNEWIDRYTIAYYTYSSEIQYSWMTITKRLSVLSIEYLNSNHFLRIILESYPTLSCSS